MAERKTAASKKKSAAKTLKIERHTAHAWWCPVCDRSSTYKVYVCAECGAEREGGTVTPKEAAA